MKGKNLILFIVLLCLISVLFLLITTYISYIAPKNGSLSYNTQFNPTTQLSIRSIIPHNSFVFVRNGDIWIGNNDQEKQLTHDSRSEKLGYFEDIIFYYSNPSVSPDRTKIAFLSFNDKASSPFPQLNVMNADGTGKKVVANDIDFTNIHRIPWSFNSKKYFI